jgi:hypothetical protein
MYMSRNEREGWYAGRKKGKHRRDNLFQLRRRRLGFELRTKKSLAGTTGRFYYTGGKP